MLTSVSDPELIESLSPSPGNSLTAFYSSKIAHRPDSGFELITDPEPTSSLDDLRTALGMPFDASVRQLTARGAIFGPRWQNYYLQYAGIVIEQASQSETSSPILRISDLDGNDIQLVQVWYQRASTFYSPVYCDIRWHPRRGEAANLTNTGGVTRWRDIKAAWRGQQLLEGINSVGRPDSSATLTQAQFIRRAPQACARLMYIFGEPPTDAQIAAELHISRATLYRYLGREGLKVNELRDMAVGIIIEPAPF